MEDSVNFSYESKGSRRMERLELDWRQEMEKMLQKGFSRD